VSGVSKINWFVRGVAALAGLMVLVGAWFATVDLGTATPDSFAFRGFDAVAAFLYVTVAFLILHSQPSNRIGGVFLGIGLFSAFYWALSQYGQAALLGGTVLPGGEYAAWFQAWGWLFLMVPLVGFVPALFPHGQFQGRFGRALFATGVLTIVVGALGIATRPGPFADEAAYAVNPLPVAFLPHDALDAATYLLLATIAVGGVALLVRTYRSGGAIERLQIKWLLSAITFLGTIFATVMVLVVFAPEWLEERRQIPEILVVIGILTIPASIGFAVTRYHLYDIEVVINRAVVYGPLTALVAASYVGAVQLSRLLFVAVTGERSDSELLLATLIAAAVFWIVRARTIGLVDRHFKDPREPAKDLRVLQGNIRQMSQIIEPTAVSTVRLTEYVLTNCVSAFDAEGGRVDFHPGHGPKTPIVVGPITSNPPISLDITHNGTVLGKLQLGHRELARAYSPRDTTPLMETAAMLAEVLFRKTDSSPVGRRRPARTRSATD
jgi:hypothetical protein